MVENSLFNTTATAAAVDVLGYACRFAILRVTIAEVTSIYSASRREQARGSQLVQVPTQVALLAQAFTLFHGLCLPSGTIAVPSKRSTWHIHLRNCR